MTADIDFIDTDTALTQLCESLSAYSWLAIDTEFERVSTYYPELCLLQLGNADITVVIDPLAIADLSPLYERLYDPATTLIFHAARQDLELFFHLKEAIPTPLFDAQIAAALLGYPEQIAYAKLVKEELNVELEKSQTRTNWKKRPLSESQLQYAADDVSYLAQLYPRLLAKLKTNEQLSAHDAQCQLLTQPAIYVPDPETRWEKINAARKLHGQTLILLKKLAAWRERTARVENQPRKWVLPDHTLVTMAKTLPVDRQTLATIKGMNKRVLRRHTDTLLTMIQQWGNGQ